MDASANLCTCLSEANTQILGMELTDFIAAAISIVTLLLNILFYIIIAPRISFRFQKKEDFLKCSAEYIEYLAKVNSLQNFDGVLTQVKSYSIKIKLLFKKGVAPKKLDALMEDVYRSIKRRKSMKSKEQIVKWEIEYRQLTKKLRIALAKYTGVF